MYPEQSSQPFHPPHHGFMPTSSSQYYEHPLSEIPPDQDPSWRSSENNLEKDGHNGRLKGLGEDKFSQ